eukprot:443021-Prorocentrum_minimum.AAC.1
MACAEWYTSVDSRRLSTVELKEVWIPTHPPVDAIEGVEMRCRQCVERLGHDPYQRRVDGTVYK